MEYLLQFDDLLEEMRGFWADQQDGTYCEKIGHMICKLQSRGLIPDKDIILPPPRAGKHNTIKKARDAR